MKKYSIFVLVIVLTAALFTGCGCTNRNMDNTSAPTTLPTTEMTLPTTEATTMPAAEPSTGMTSAPTENDAAGSTNETVDNGNGPLEDTDTTEGTAEGRARQTTPNG